KDAAHHPRRPRAQPHAAGLRPRPRGARRGLIDRGDTACQSTDAGLWSAPAPTASSNRRRRPSAPGSRRTRRRGWARRDRRERARLPGGAPLRRDGHDQPRWLAPTHRDVVRPASDRGRRAAERDPWASEGTEPSPRSADGDLRRRRHALRHLERHRRAGRGPGRPGARGERAHRAALHRPAPRLAAVGRYQGLGPDRDPAARREGPRPRPLSDGAWSTRGPASGAGCRPVHGEVAPHLPGAGGRETAWPWRPRPLSAITRSSRHGPTHPAAAASPLVHPHAEPAARNTAPAGRRDGADGAATSADWRRSRPRGTARTARGRPVPGDQPKSRRPTQIAARDAATPLAIALCPRKPEITRPQDLAQPAGSIASQAQSSSPHTANVRTTAWRTPSPPRRRSIDPHCAVAGLTQAWPPRRPPAP